MPRGEPQKKEVYGLIWPIATHPAQIEIQFIRWGGYKKLKSGGTVGNGLFFHHKRFQQLTCPEKVWHKWNELLLKHFIENRIIGVLGAASSGKSREAADFVRHFYYAWPECTTVICSSTERETLEDRIWGEIKRQHRLARQIIEWLPGYVIDSRQRIVTDKSDVFSEEGRDFRNGMVGVPCKKSGVYQGLSAYSGRKNRFVILVCDEGSHMPRAYVDAFSNLNKNENFKGIVLANPKDTTDAAGVICEPSEELGGWDGGIDQNPGTKVWNIRWPNGVCVQLPGSDSPNLDGKLGIPLLTQEQIDADIKFYGKDSLQYTMMDEARMPRGQGLKRVLTRQKCLKFGAMEEPIWKDDKQTSITFLDASYGSVGGDRCVFGELKFGLDINNKMIMALIDTMLVPINASGNESDKDKIKIPEDQIAEFVKEECERRNSPPENFGFDSTGRGSLMQSFGKIWSNNVNAIEFGGHPTDRPVAGNVDITCKDYYSKFVSELWYSVALVVTSGQFRGMTEQVMMEFCMREWGLTVSNKTEVEPKDKMKLKTGRSPDLADAVSCGVEVARRRGFIIRMESSPNSKRDDEWKTTLREKSLRFHESHTLYAA